MKVCIYANCQGDGVAHFLRKSSKAPDLDISVHRNFQLMLGEQSPADLLAAVSEADVFIYQPTDAFPAKDGTIVRSTDDMVAELFRGRPEHAISFAYQLNTGFFPIVKSGKWWTGDEVLEIARGSVWFDVVTCYDRNMLNYDCARRFIENLAEQARREETTTIKMAPWILQNYRTKHMFLLHNHPASALLEELTHQILFQFKSCLDRVHYDGPNDANLPGYHAVHPAVIKELGLTYEPDRRGEDAVYYRTLIEELAKTRGVL